MRKEDSHVTTRGKVVVIGLFGVIAALQVVTYLVHQLSLEVLLGGCDAIMFILLFMIPTVKKAKTQKVTATQQVPQEPQVQVVQKVTVIAYIVKGKERLAELTTELEAESDQFKQLKAISARALQGPKRLDQSTQNAFFTSFRSAEPKEIISWERANLRIVYCVRCYHCHPISDGTQGPQCMIGLCSTKDTPYTGALNIPLVFSAQTAKQIKAMVRKEVWQLMQPQVEGFHIATRQ